MSAVRGGVVLCGHFSDKGGGSPHFLVQKTPDFSKFMMCLHGQGGEGVEPVQSRHFADRGEGPIFL